MSDSFNPHEILSRLRASKPPPAGGSAPTAQVFGGLDNSGGLLPPAAPATAGATSYLTNQNLNGNASSPSSAVRRQASAAVNNSATPGSPQRPGSKMIKTPMALTLTPSQRQENLAVRAELEKELKRLQEENNKLKSENQQLRVDKQDVEQQLISLRLKHEETVVKLRGKIAQLQQSKFGPLPRERTGGGNNSKVASSKIPGGKLYPTNPPSKSKLSSSASAGADNGPLTMQQLQQHQQYTAGQQQEGFRDPTFSELMRRSTPDHPEWGDSLRRERHHTNSQQHHSSSGGQQFQHHSNGSHHGAGPATSHGHHHAPSTQYVNHPQQHHTLRSFNNEMAELMAHSGHIMGDSGNSSGGVGVATRQSVVAAPRRSSQNSIGYHHIDGANASAPAPAIGSGYEDIDDLPVIEIDLSR